jgi:integrase/recombinase XerD
MTRDELKKELQSLSKMAKEKQGTTAETFTGQPLRELYWDIQLTCEELLDRSARMAPQTLQNRLQEINQRFQSAEVMYRVHESNKLDRLQEAAQTGELQSGEYLDSFQDYMKENEKSQNTINSYLIDLKQFLEHIKNPLQITKQDIKGYRDLLKGRKLSVKTINRKLVSVKQFIDFLNECFDARLIIKIRPEKEQQQGFIEEMLTKEDYNALAAATDRAGDRRAKAIFATLFYTGMRVSEMLQLKIDDIHKDEVTILGKGNKYRNILINRKLKPIWKEYARVRETDKGTELFVGQRGAINRQTVHNLIKDYAEQVGVKAARAHAHSFRHLFCVSLIEEGLTIDKVAKLAGHSDINTTKIYTEMTKQDYFNAINKL